MNTMWLTNRQSHLVNPILGMAIYHLFLIKLRMVYEHNVVCYRTWAWVKSIPKKMTWLSPIARCLIFLMGKTVFDDFGSKIWEPPLVGSKVLIAFQ